MILVDVKGDKKDKHPGLDIINHIKRLGVACEQADLRYADATFEGYALDGSGGRIQVGIERKSLHDMLQCIDDARYTGHQRIGMRKMFGASILMVEGHWRPHDPAGYLMEGFSGGSSWGYCQYRSHRTMYDKLYRYLLSVALSGVVVSHSRDVFHTAFNIKECYHYFQKRKHDSLLAVQKHAIPTLNDKPSLVRRWANDIDSVGLTRSEQAEQLFKTPIALATADEMAWLKIRGVGVPTAQQIVRDIWGVK